METKIAEFEAYLDTVTAGLKMAASCRAEIRRELEQNLYEKYDELLIKGYSMVDGVSAVLAAFEDSCKLAIMFNRAYQRSVLSRGCAAFRKTVRLLRDKGARVGAVLAAAVIRLMTL